MEIFEGHRALFRPLAAPAVALGNFDGVHAGHLELLRRTVAAARELGGDAVVYTFEPHPAKVLAPDLAPPLITTVARKRELVAEAGIDVCIEEPFTRELASIEPVPFVEDILVRVVGARHVVVGYDFTFGKARAGHVDLLQELGAEHGFATEVVAPVEVSGIVASSTKVREFVEEGNCGGARLLLGRDFEVCGEVVKGAGRGSTIGIPTANVAPDNELLPKGGVYAVRFEILDGEAASQPLPGAANLGTNPTFGADAGLSLEVHLLDFSGDLYGRRVRVSFVERIRGERRFAGPDELVAQIHRDIDTARATLSK